MILVWLGSMHALWPSLLPGMLCPTGRMRYDSGAVLCAGGGVRLGIPHPSFEAYNEADAGYWLKAIHFFTSSTQALRAQPAAPSYP